MLIVEAFAAKDYKNTNGLKFVDVNVPALFPLKPSNGASVTESINNVYKNKLAISNTVTAMNFLTLPVATVIPKEIKKGHTFILISPDENPYNGVLLTKYITTEGPSNVLPKYASHPSSPTPGMMYFNSTENKPYIFNNSQWTLIGSGTGGGSMTTEEIINAILQSPDYKLVTPAEKTEWNNKQTKLELISLTDAIAGTGTDIKGWSAERVRKAAEAIERVVTINGESGPVTITAEKINATPVSHIGSGGTSHAIVSSTEAGFMSPGMLSKLNNVDENGEQNQNAFSIISIAGQSNINAKVETDTLNIEAGSNVTITANPTTATITISAAGYVHPTSDGNLHVPATGTSNNGKFLKAGATAGSLSWSQILASDVGLGNVTNESKATMFANPTFTGTPTAPTAAVGNNTTQIATTAFVKAQISNDSAPKSHVGSTGSAHGLATVSVDGFMSKEYAYKLESIQNGAQLNQNAFSFLRINDSETISADSISDTINIVAGANITIGVDSLTDTITISSVDSYIHPTSDGNLHVPATGTTNNGKVLKAGATAGSLSWGTLTAADVGLGNVTNESKATMFSNPTFTGTVTGVTAAMVGLGNVTNQSKATMFTNPTFTGTVTGVTAAMVGLGNVTNESKATMFANPAFTGTPTAPTATAGTNTTQIATTAFVVNALSNYQLPLIVTFDKVTVNNEVRIKDGASIKYGGVTDSDSKVETKYNATTKSLDFIFN